MQLHAFVVHICDRLTWCIAQFLTGLAPNVGPSSTEGKPQNVKHSAQTTPSLGSHDVRKPIERPAAEQLASLPSGKRRQVECVSCIYWFTPILHETAEIDSMIPASI